MTRYPLSSAQQEVWFGQLADPTGRRYVIGQYHVITGPLDVDRFIEAVRSVMRGAATLRLRIHADGTCEIGPEVPIEVPLIDLSTVRDPMGRAGRHMTTRIGEPIDISTDPLFSHELLRVDGQTHVWFQRYHHIAVDALSMGLLAEDVAAHYTDPHTARPRPSLAALLLAEARYRSSTAHDADRAYWLSRVTPTIAPTLAARACPPRGRAHRLSLDVRPSLAAGLRELATRAGTRWPRALIAGFAAYLHRLTGHTEIGLAVPVAARTDRHLRTVPAMTANILPFRVTVDPSFAPVTLTQHTGARLRALLARQRYRGEDLVRELALPGGMASFGPSVNIRLDIPEPRFGSCRSQVHDLSVNHVDDLSLVVSGDQDHGPTRFDFAANPELYSEAELAAHARRLIRFLDRFPSAGPIGTIDPLRAVERQRVLHAWNGGVSSIPTTPLHERIHRQAHRDPRRIAIEHGRRSTTYAALEATAARLANLLISRGIGHGDIVAVEVARTAALPTALYGVLKTGAAYLPIDPSLPERRRAVLRRDATATVNAADPAGDGIDISDLSDWPTTTPDVRITPDDPAYVIHTSGTTGTPKAVVITHGNVTNLLAAMDQLVPLTSDDRVCALTPVTFDIALLELLAPLTSGARVVLVGDETANDPTALVTALRERRVSVAQTTPTRWRALLDTGSPLPRGLRILTGGETLPLDLAHRLRAPGHVVINLYGPTETCVWTSAHQLTGTEPPTPPIGRPFPNTRVYVLNPLGQPVPPGCPGEIHIAGAGVALGYLNDPRHTARRFVPDPFADGRMYRTGDRARWTENGELEHLGRLDDRLKVRGCRVEPAEIEVALTRHPEIRQAVAVTDDDRLLAYVLAPRGLDHAAVRAELATTLPEYLIPSELIVVDRIPVTRNGKLDRRALPTPEPGPAPRPPADELERVLCRVFAAALAVPVVHPDDDFFAIGGHSLLVARVTADFAARTGRTVPPRTLFATRTAAALARALNSAGGTPLDLTQETHLDPGIPFHPGMDPASETVLTGATGFVGAHLLAELLDSGEVVCPVRARSAQHGLSRIRAALNRYHLWRPELAERIVAMPADLGEPLFGWSAHSFATLARRTGWVYHAAAEVNLIDSYARLRPANVDGTRTVIRLAALSGARLHHLSSASVARSRRGRRGPIPEDHRVPADEVPPVPYPASKWVAEELVRSAAERGLPVWIHRLGRITGHSVTGACAANDSFWTFVAASVRLGVAPIVGGAIDLTPVDYAIASISRLSTLPPGVFGLTNPYPTPISRILNHLREHGTHLDEVPVQIWRRLLRAGHRDPELARAALLADTEWNQAPALDNTRTLRLLGSHGVRCPNIDDELIARTIRYFREHDMMIPNEPVIPVQSALPRRSAQSTRPDRPVEI